MQKLNHFDPYYLPYLSKNPVLSLLYDWWRKKQPKSLPNVECMRVFLPYPDAGFTVMWFHLFPDVEQGSKWPIPRQRPLQGARKTLAELRKKNPEALYHPARVSRNKYMVYSMAMYLFILDQLRPRIRGIIKSFQSYYQRRMPTEEAMRDCVEESLRTALLVNNPFLRLGLYFEASASKSKLDPSCYWGSFWQVDIWERFKEYLYRAIGEPSLELTRLDDREFSAVFEKEWRRALKFQDGTGGFRIIPLFTHADMVRYGNLSRNNQDIAYQMVDYVVLRICPKLMQPLDHIETRRLTKWKNLLLELMRPLVEQIIEEHAAIKNEGQVNEFERGLTQKEEKKLRQNIQSTVLKLATKEYYYLHGKKQVSLEIRKLMDEIESNSKKIEAWKKKEDITGKTVTDLLQKQDRLTGKLLASSLKMGGTHIDYPEAVIPWGYFLGSISDTKMQDIKKRGAYPKKAMFRRIQNLKQKLRKAEQEKDWKGARKLSSELGRAERERRAGESILKRREKWRWVRPSYFIYETIHKIYLPQKDRKLAWAGSMQSGDQGERGEPWDDQSAREARDSGAKTPKEYTDLASLEIISRRQYLGRSITEDDSRERREYVTLRDLSVALGCSRKTLMRLEESGEIEFESKRVKGGKVVQQGGRWLKLFPKKQINEIKHCFVKDKEIAKIAGVRPDYIPKLKKKLSWDELPRLEQKKKLVEWAKQRRRRNRRE